MPIENKDIVQSSSHRHYSSGVYNKYVTNHTIIIGFSQNSICVYRIENGKRKVGTHQSRGVPITVCAYAYGNGHTQFAGVVRIRFEPFFDMNLRDEFIYEMNHILNCRYEVK